MTHDLDERLRGSLHDHVDGVRPPAPDLRCLVRRGRRRRDRRLGGVALAVVAVVAAAVGLSALAGQEPQGAGDPAGRLPVVRGDASGPTPVEGPRQLFVSEGRVFMDGRTFAAATPESTGAHVGQLGLAYPRRGDHHPMLLRRDGRDLALGAALPRGSAYDDWVAADSDGPLVAWTQRQGTAATVVAYDTGSMAEVARLSLPCHRVDGELTCPRPYIADAGVVFLDLGDGNGGAQAWLPDTGRRIDLGRDLPNQAHAQVLTTFEGQGTVPVRRLGAGWRQADPPRGIEGLLSFDGAWVLDANGSPRVVDTRDASRSITYRPPGQVAQAQFDTDGSVLVVTTRRVDGLDDDTSVQMNPGQSDRGARYTGWDCRLGGRCRVVVPEQTAELSLVAWDS